MSDQDQQSDPAPDWDALERSPEFQELAASRRRFVTPAHREHPTGFIGCFLGTLLSVPEDRVFRELRVRSDTGIGAETG